MADNRRYASLDEALRAKRIPLENWSLIRAIATSIGISEFQERSSYIKALRHDGGRALKIQYGWTEGLASWEEAAEFKNFENTGNDVWPDQTSWVVDHPVNQLRAPSGAAHARPSEIEICPHCAMALPASGICDCQE